MIPWECAVLIVPNRKFQQYLECSVTVRVGVLCKEAMFKTHPMNVLNERTLKGTFFGNYMRHSDLLSIIDKYMKKVHIICRSLSHIQFHS
ncbi:hypothetical protein AMTRI_Chr05g61280 [Amborella trichopoda]